MLGKLIFSRYPNVRLHKIDSYYHLIRVVALGVPYSLLKCRIFHNDFDLLYSAILLGIRNAVTDKVGLNTFFTIDRKLHTVENNS